MDEIIWSSRAIRDADSIFTFIALDSMFHAKKWLNKIYARTTILMEHPQLGRVVPEIKNKEIRELIEGNYRIMYRISRQQIIIYRIIHTSRNFK